VRHARVVAFGLAMCVAVLTGCAQPVRGVPSAAETTTAAPSSADPTPGTFPGGAQPSCLVDDTCGEEGQGESVQPAGLVCGPLPAAMTAFDRQARALFPGGQLTTTGPDAALSALADLVFDVVDRCGFRVMIDVADQYPDPLYGWLQLTAVTGLGEISALPGGLRCAELQTLGLGPKQAVDYWFLWGGPGLMDADANGVPCETVWPDVSQYMPPNW
jgi:hypothetical protein